MRKSVILETIVLALGLTGALNCFAQTGLGNGTTVVDASAPPYSGNIQSAINALPSCTLSNYLTSIGTTVTTSSSGNTVTQTSGARVFTTGSAWVGLSVAINHVPYVVKSVKGSTELVLTTSPGNQTGVPFFISVYQNYTYNHCGEVIVPPGSYPFSSQIYNSSPFVTLRCSDPGSTVLNWTGSGIAILWTSLPWINEFAGGGGIYNCGINGAGSTAPSTGLYTDSINNIHLRGNAISNFTGTGSSGWTHSDVFHGGYNEKFDVEMTLKNNNIDWLVYAPGSTGGYTYGYGTFDVKAECFATQTCFQFNGPGLTPYGIFSESALHLTANLASDPCNATGINIGGNFTWYDNTGLIHIECSSGSIGSGHEIKVGVGSNFTFEGALNQDFPRSNLISGSFTPSQVMGPAIVTGALSVGGTVRGNGFFQETGVNTFAGTCSMTGGMTCSFTEAATFTHTPICIASVQGTPIAGSCALSGSTVTITAASSNSSTWGALLIGNPN